ncbi:MAG: hypothetical protein ABIQ39_11170, partial [Ilumatobacteraceae bacterium]
ASHAGGAHRGGTSPATAAIHAASTTPGPSAPNHPGDSAAASRRWAADAHASTGTNLATAAVATVYDATEFGADFAASVFGLSAGTSTEMFGSLEQHRRDDTAAVLHPGGTPAATHDAAAPTEHQTSGTAAAAGHQTGAIGGRTDAERRTSAAGGELLSLDHIDIGELAGRLYPDISSRLRHELLIDRERAGRLADLR